MQDDTVAIFTKIDQSIPNYLGGYPLLYSLSVTYLKLSYNSMGLWIPLSGFILTRSRSGKTPPPGTTNHTTGREFKSNKVWG